MPKIKNWEKVVDGNAPDPSRATKRVVLAYKHEESGRKVKLWGEALPDANAVRYRIEGAHGVNGTSRQRRNRKKMEKLLRKYLRKNS